MQWKRVFGWGCVTNVVAGGAIALFPSIANSHVNPSLFSTSATVEYGNQTSLPRAELKQDDLIQPRISCPDDLETLTQLMLRDLPGYANRVSQRARDRDRIVDLYTFVILAAQPEFMPLTLGPGSYNPASSDAATDLQQVFFTTLEREYVGDRTELLQHFHWLFLAKTERGWWFGLMASRIGGYPDNQPQSPPRDSSHGVIAQAIRLWLRDCRAGAIAPFDAPFDAPTSSNKPLPSDY
ncbi:MAG: hypothetical protein ACFE0I_13005 [Elainellaceae cyanobacterium]